MQYRIAAGLILQQEEKNHTEMLINAKSNKKNKHLTNMLC